VLDVHPVGFTPGFSIRIYHGIRRVSGWQDKSNSSGWNPVAFMAITISISICEIAGNNAGLTGADGR